MVWEFEFSWGRFQFFLCFSFVLEDLLRILKDFVDNSIRYFKVC